MPYTLVKRGAKAQVKKKQPGRPVYLSKKPIPISRAKAQMRALYRAEGIKKKK